MSGTDSEEQTVRLWLVERTYSDDEQNIVIIVYATPDGEHYHRKERALVSFSDDRQTTAAVEVPEAEVGTVSDPETRAQYAEAATRTKERYEPGEAI